jgi:hypothetical protein
MNATIGSIAMTNICQYRVLGDHYNLMVHLLTQTLETDQGSRTLKETSPYQLLKGLTSTLKQNPFFPILF